MINLFCKWWSPVESKDRVCLRVGLTFGICLATVQEYAQSDPLVVQFENPRWQQPNCLARGFKIWFHQPRDSIFYIQFMTSLQIVQFASVQNISLMCFHCWDHSSPENSHTGTTGFFLYYSECCTAVTASNHATLHTLVPMFCTVTVMRAL